MIKLQDGKLCIFGMTISKKLTALFLSIGLPILNETTGLGLPIEVILGAFGLAGTYVLGQGYADGKKSNN